MKVLACFSPIPQMFSVLLKEVSIFLTRSQDPLLIVVLVSAAVFLSLPRWQSSYRCCIWVFLFPSPLISLTHFLVKLQLFWLPILLELEKARYGSRCLNHFFSLVLIDVWQAQQVGR